MHRFDSIYKIIEGCTVNKPIYFFCFTEQSHCDKSVIAPYCDTEGVSG